MLDEIRLLRPFAAAARALGERAARPRLYAPERLRDNAVPVVAAVYARDLFVPLELSLRTARAVGNLTTWVTDEWQHDGLRVSGHAVVRHLLRLLDERGGPLR